uniref:Ycf34 n=1 Tax=Crouania attenuata TaxID=42002 RepID=A0A4D6WNX8_9FLOR|nr:hypothetical protein [Crouania attenuata]
MCICVNCRHIKICRTYLFIEQQHKQQKKIDIVKQFVPSNTIVTVNLYYRTYMNIKLDWDLIECSSFIEKPGYWIK